jgi:Uma2 family endonuclease
MASAVSPVAERQAVPPLENGARLSAHEFLRRYTAMPELKKAELINGVVYMPSPVRLTQHAEPDNSIQGWLFTYATFTPGTRAGANATTRLGPDDVSQPDALLRILPECGGQARVDAAGYLRGAPELVVEVAASSASIDARDKLQSYRRSGVSEYLLWRVEDAKVDWWALEDDEYRPLASDAEGLLRSRVFPGLWLDVGALLSCDGARLLQALQAGLADSAHSEFVQGLQTRRAPG